jgi:hypothetical protein
MSLQFACEFSVISIVFTGLVGDCSCELINMTDYK